MEITTELVKELRDRTSVSIMQCKKALEEAEGDIEKAEVIVRKRSAAASEKKSDRELGAGAIGMYVHSGEIGAMVLLSCETDFVARNDEFPALAREIAMQVAATNPTYLQNTDIDPTAVEAAKSVFTLEVADKPKEMQEKILEGKMASYFKDQVLMNQPYIKNDSMTITDLITQASQKFGEKVVISKFSRFSAR
jgi:elongation factor Ts